VGDIHAEPDFLQVGDLTLVLLERGNHHLICVWAKHSKARKNFTGFKNFPVDQKYHIAAKFSPYEKPKILRIQDVIEIHHVVPYPGYVTFDMDGHACHLEATTDEDSLFLSFNDKPMAIQPTGVVVIWWRNCQRMIKSSWISIQRTTLHAHTQILLLSHSAIPKSFGSKDRSWGKII
jgi:hypothetical protein